jgi:hypothetical protein
MIALTFFANFTAVKDEKYIGTLLSIGFIFVDLFLLSKKEAVRICGSS